MFAVPISILKFYFDLVSFQEGKCFPISAQVVQDIHFFSFCDFLNCIICICQHRASCKMKIFLRKVTTLLGLLPCFYHLFFICAHAVLASIQVSYSVQVSSSSCMEMCFLGGWELEEFDKVNTCLVLWQPSLSFYSRLSWVGWALAPALMSD